MNHPIVAIDMRMAGKDYFYDLYKFTMMYEWLTHCDIDFKLIYVTPDDDSVPHTIIMSDIDAIAFKMKFNL